MGSFAIERTVAVPPRQVWNVITDWAGYARWMPLTTMRLDQGPTQIGWSFAGLTGVGRVRFCDAMRITAWDPPLSEADPGTFRLLKVGRLLAGWAEVSVLPLAGGAATRLLWRENIVIRPIVLGRVLAPLSDRANKALFAKVIDDMAREALETMEAVRAPRQPESQQRGAPQPESQQRGAPEPEPRPPHGSQPDPGPQ